MAVPPNLPAQDAKAEIDELREDLYRMQKEIIELHECKAGLIANIDNLTTRISEVNESMREWNDQMIINGKELTKLNKEMEVYINLKNNVSGGFNVIKFIAKGVLWLGTVAAAVAAILHLGDFDWKDVFRK